MIRKLPSVTLSPGVTLMSFDERFRLLAAIDSASDGYPVPKKSTVVISLRTPPSSSGMRLKSPTDAATLPISAMGNASSSPAYTSVDAEGAAFAFTKSGICISGLPLGGKRLAFKSMGRTTLPAFLILMAKRRSVLRACSASLRMAPISLMAAFVAGGATGAGAVTG